MKRSPSLCGLDYDSNADVADSISIWDSQADRERQVQEMAAKLEGLWQHLHMGEGDVDRELVTKLLGSGERLFQSTMATVRERRPRSARNSCMCAFCALIWAPRITILDEADQRWVGCDAM